MTRFLKSLVLGALVTLSSSLLAPSEARASFWLEVKDYIENGLLSTTPVVVARSVYEVLSGAPCVDGMRQVYVSQPDNWGFSDSEKEMVYIHCDPGPVASDEQLISRYQLTSDSTRKLKEFLAAAAHDDRMLLDQVGLTHDDLDRMARYQLPSSEGLHRLSVALKIEYRETKRALKKLLRDAEILNQLEAAEARGEVRHY
jgi:hypothetical protein